MIDGIHALIYSDDADATRAFFRDILGLRHVDDGDGWLIFALPPAELGIHPGPGWGKQTSHHELFLMCHDVEQTIADLASKGVESLGPITDEEWGRVTRLRIPGGGQLGLYEPKHTSPLAEFGNA